MKSIMYFFSSRAASFFSSAASILWPHSMSFPQHWLLTSLSSITNNRYQYRKNIITGWSLLLPQIQGPEKAYFETQIKISVTKEGELTGFTEAQRQQLKIIS